MGFVAYAPRAECFCCRWRLSGVAIESRGPCVRADETLLLRYLEASAIKIGAHCSPSRVAPGPILATLGIRALLAPHLRSRPARMTKPNIFAWAFRVSLFSSKQRRLILADLCRIAFKPHLLNRWLLVHLSLPTRDARIVRQLFGAGIDFNDLQTICLKSNAAAHGCRG